MREVWGEAKPLHLKELWSLAGLIELVQMHNGVDAADAARQAIKLLGEG